MGPDAGVVCLLGRSCIRAQLEKAGVEEKDVDTCMGDSTADSPHDLLEVRTNSAIVHMIRMLHAVAAGASLGTTRLCPLPILLSLRQQLGVKN